MSRMRGSAVGYVLAGMCLVVVAGGPAVARAQGASVESTPQACSDRIDNDGDGYVDCYDPDCAAVCQRPAPAPTYAPPPAQPAPPPTYYAPPPAQPPPVYYQPAPVYRPVYVAPIYAPPIQPYTPRRGIGDVIAGFIFLGLGVGLIGGSVPLWQSCGRASCFSDAYLGYGWGAVFMDIFGSAFLVTSLILIPVGFVKEAKYNKWMKERAAGRPVSFLERFTPTLSAGPNGANAGFKLTF